MEENDKEVSIIVNGRAKSVHHHELSFDQVVALAFGEVHNNPDVVYTVTYSWGPTEEGTMVGGGTAIIPKEGMILNVSRTDKS